MPTTHKSVLHICSYAGIAAVALIGFSYLLAGYVPIPSPSETAEETRLFTIENRNAIRFGMIGAMMGAALLIIWSASLCIQMRRIEGKHSILAFIQLGAGAILALEFIYLTFFWQTATFRMDRSAELIQLLIDMAWIPFVGLSSTLIMQAIILGIAILIDPNRPSIYPRWLGYFSLFSGFMFVPGTFNVFFKTGPFAWNGLIAIYIPAVVYVIWTVFTCVYTARAVQAMPNES